jgi:hypothetical protein
LQGRQFSTVRPNFIPAVSDLDAVSLTFSRPVKTSCFVIPFILQYLRKIAPMDVKALDKALLEILKKREELSKIDYNNPKYDDLEEALHDLEDDFQDEYGDYLEEALQSVHDNVCPENDVLMPIAYLGKGVPVEVDRLAGKDTKLILATEPPRILLAIGKDKQELMWTAK